MLWFIALLPHWVAAQNASISGSVLSKSGEVLPFVHVSLRDGRAGAITDRLGLFTIQNVPLGEQVLTATMVGYSNASLALTITGEMSDVKIIMTDRPIDLPEFTVQNSFTGGAEKVRSTAGSAWYIGPREIELHANTDVSRLLRSVPGVNIQEEDGFGLRPNIGMRGAPAERSAKITIMEDGVLTAPAPYAEPAAYYFPTVGRMHGVEVVKGSSQIRTGPLTTGGSINFLSTPVPNETMGRVSMWGGSYGLRNLHAHAGTTHKGFGALVEIFQSAADGFKELDAPGGTGFKKSDLLAKLQWHSHAKARYQQAISLKAVLTDEVSDETYLGLSRADFAATPLRRYAGSARDRMEVRHDLLTARYAITIPGGPQLAVTAYRTNTYRNWYKLDQVVDTAGVKFGIATLLNDPRASVYAFNVLRGGNSASNALLLKANNRNYQSSGIQVSADHTIAREKAEHHFELGLRTHSDGMDRYQWTDGYRMQENIMLQTSAGTPGTESNRISSAQALAAHFAYDLQLGRVGLHPGIRREVITLEQRNYGTQDPGRSGLALTTTSNTVEVWIPGMAIDLRMHEQVLVFAGVHRGFSPPGSNPLTKPEASINQEIGIRWDRAGLNVQAIGFINAYQELLGADMAAAGGVGTGDLFNGGRALVQGLELHVMHDPLQARSERYRLPITMAYTYTDARFSSNFQSSFAGWGNVIEGNALPYIAAHQVNGRVGLEGAWGGLSAGITYVSDMPAQAGSLANEESQRIPAFSVIDLAANYRWSPSAEFFATAQNVLDRTYMVSLVPAGARPGLPRALQAGLRFRF